MDIAMIIQTLNIATMTVETVAVEMPTLTIALNACVSGPNFILWLFKQNWMLFANKDICQYTISLILSSPRSAKIQL